MALKHLVGYMAAHPEQCISLKWKGLHAGVFKQYENEEPMVEIFSDADWAADRETRRSVSGAAIYVVATQLADETLFPLVLKRS